MFGTYYSFWLPKHQLQPLCIINAKPCSYCSANKYCRGCDSCITYAKVSHHAGADLFWPRRNKRFAKRLTTSELHLNEAACRAVRACTPQSCTLFALLSRCSTCCATSDDISKCNYLTASNVCFEAAMLAALHMQMHIKARCYCKYHGM